jgi:hypothetical protein
MAPPANPAAALAAAASACRRDNIVPGQILFAGGGCRRHGSKCIGRACGLP